MATVNTSDATIRISRGRDGYAVEAALPLTRREFAPRTGVSYKIDLGVIYSDAKGDNRAARVYWTNKATGLVSDVPGEVMAAPNLWGRAMVDRQPSGKKPSAAYYLAAGDPRWHGPYGG